MRSRERNLFLPMVLAFVVFDPRAHAQDAEPAEDCAVEANHDLESIAADESPASAGPAAPPSDDDADMIVGSLVGDYELRAHAMSHIPLQPLPRDASGSTAELGQNFWVTHWLRLHGEAGLRERFRLVGEADLFDGLVVGDFAQGVGPAEQPREDGESFADVHPRALYLEWISQAGMVRAGLMTSQWGLGIVANDGAQETPFGDPTFGDTVARLMFAAKPFGLRSPWAVFAAGDLVYNDITADLSDNEDALQGVGAIVYQEGTHEAGVYGVYRSQRSEYDAPSGTHEDTLRIWVGDAYVRWDTSEPSGGRLFAAAEGAMIRGRTTLFRNTSRGFHHVRQRMVVGQLGRDGEDVDFTFEGGWTSGDSNTEDAFQRRATLDPDHRVGMILFPEVVAWNTARSAALAQSEVLFGRPAPGSGLLPTNGGVAGALYLFPWAGWQVTKWLELRMGAVWARASSAVVDPFAQRSRSESVNYQGGSAAARDLGLEVDGAALMRFELPHGAILSAGLEGGWFMPGRAFDDARGVPMDRVGLVRGRFGLRF